MRKGSYTKGFTTELKDNELATFQNVQNYLKKDEAANLEPKELINLGEEYWNNLNLRSAELVMYYNAYKHKDDEQSNFFYGYFCFETGQFSKAEELLKKAVEISPLTNPKKYFTLAEIVGGNDSLNHYLTGIKIAELKLKDIENDSGNTPKSPRRSRKSSKNMDIESDNKDTEKTSSLQKKFNLKRNLSQAYCAVAEILMQVEKLNNNVNDIQEAQKKAIEIDPKYLEPYYQYTFFYFNLGLETECRQTLDLLTKKLKGYEKAQVSFFYYKKIG